MKLHGLPQEIIYKCLSFYIYVNFSLFLWFSLLRLRIDGSGAGFLWQLHKDVLALSDEDLAKATTEINAALLNARSAWVNNSCLTSLNRKMLVTCHGRRLGQTMMIDVRMYDNVRIYIYIYCIKTFKNQETLCEKCWWLLSGEYSPILPFLGLRNCYLPRYCNSSIAPRGTSG